MPVLDAQKDEADITMAVYLSLIKELVDICPGLKDICRQQYNLIQMLYDYLFRLPRREVT